MAAIRRARTMPTPDDSDRCNRCGKVIKKGEARTVVDDTYDRTMRVDPRCAATLRGMSGFREVDLRE